MSSSHSDYLSNKREQIERKLKNLEEHMVSLDKRLDKEKQHLKGKQEPLEQCDDCYNTNQKFSISSLKDSVAPTFRQGMGDAPLACQNYFHAEVPLPKPTLFFSWNSSLDDFKSKWIHRKLTSILSEGGENGVTGELFVERLKSSLFDPEEALTATYPSESDNIFVETKETVVHLCEEKLKQVEEKCLKQLANDEILVDERRQHCLDICSFQEHPRIEEIKIDQSGPILDEDIILECFKEPDMTDYKTLPFTQVVKELETLGTMVKTFNDIVVPKFDFEDCSAIQ